MAMKKVHTNIDEDKYNYIVDNKLGFAELLDAAVTCHLNGEDVFYAKPKLDLHASLSEQIAAREIVEQRLEVYNGRLAAINEKIKLLEEELLTTEQHAKESAQSTRITQLLREINQAIVYNDYKIPDIELVVKKQLKEIKKLQPDFSLEQQIVTMKKYSS